MKHFVLFLAFLLPLSVSGQFIPDIRLTDADSISYTPFNNSQCIAVSGNNVHVTWTDRRDGAGEVFYKRSTDGGMTWSADLRLTPDDDIFSGRATIAVWQNEVHLIWMDRRDGNNELYYKRSMNNGNSWDDDVRLTTNASNSEYPSLAIRFQSLHLVWNDDRHGTNEIYYKRSINGGLSWGVDTRLTNNAGDSYKASVGVGGTTIHVAWEDLRNGTSEIFYKKSNDNGLMWGSDTKLSNSASDCYSPCMSANGPIAFVGWDDNRTAATEIYTRRSMDNGNTWSPEFNMSNSFATSYNVQHTFSGPFMFLVWNEEVGSGSEIYSRFSTDAGLTWNPTRPLTTDPDISDQPFVGIGGSDVHVVWQDERDGNREIYYTRNPNGNPFDHINTLAWGHSFGDLNNDVAYAITSDIYSNVYVAGAFRGTVDFDPGPALLNLTADGSADAFIYKLNPQGELVWAKKVGGPETDIAYGIALDEQWNVLVTGSFHATADFNPGAGILELHSAGQEDAFVVKLNSNGIFRWARRVGGGGRDEGRSIASGADNEVITTGYFSETGDFDPGANMDLLTSQGEEDIFISHLDENGMHVSAQGIGGIGFDAGRCLTVDHEGNRIVTGYFEDVVDFDPNAGVLMMSSYGASDAFILKLDANGDFVLANHVGGDEDDEGNGVTTDPLGNIYITGLFNDEANFDPVGSVFNLTSAGDDDVFVVKLESTSFDMTWAVRMGGPNTDEGRAISCHEGHIYVTGHFQNTADFHPGVEVVELRSSGSSDVFLQKLTEAGEFVWLNQFGGTQEDIGYAVCHVLYGKTGVAGFYNGTGEFSPEIELQYYTSAGDEDAFVSVIRDCIPSTSTLDETACESFSIPFPDTTFTESGVYTIYMESAEGCDSIITLNLTVLSNQEVSVTETACDRYTTPSGNHTWNASGVYSETLPGSNGCDSIVTYNLTILNSTGGFEDIHACDQYTTPEGETLTKSGVYVFELVNAAGCDSTHTLNLTIGHTSSASVSMSACDSLVSPSGMQTWYASGTYQDIIPNAAGCDSVIAIELTLSTTTYGDLAADICESFTTPDGDTTWYESGIYTFIIPNASGCDSVVTLDLGIYDLDLSVTLQESILTANLSGGEYVWLDCNQNYALIPGQTAQSFAPEVSGSYAVIVITSACADTSACYEVMIVGLDQFSGTDHALVYPNPAKEVVYVRLDRNYPELDVHMADVHGKMLFTARYSDTSLIQIDINQPSGIYLLTLISEGRRVTYRLIK